VFDSEDVVATVKRILDSRDRIGVRVPTSPWSTSVEAVDPLTVRFNLKPVLCGPSPTSFAGPAVAHRRQGPTGRPFDPANRHPGHSYSNPGRRATRLELTKNPDYFEKEVPKLDGVTLRIIPGVRGAHRGARIRRDR